MTIKEHCHLFIYKVIWVQDRSKKKFLFLLLVSYFRTQNAAKVKEIGNKKQWNSFDNQWWQTLCYVFSIVSSNIIFTLSLLLDTTLFHE